MNLFDGCEGKNLASGLEWLNEPPVWNFEEGCLEVVPKGETDFFRPSGREGNDNAGLLYTWVEGDFTAKTRVRTELVAFGDAGVLTVRAGAEQSAKLCVERSPIGDLSIVSVITDPWSDDANNELLEEAEAFLRISREGNVFGMHYSLDGKVWRFVRTFTCDMPARVMVGVHAQAPFQEGCRATFDFLEVSSKPVGDFRSGE